VILVAIVVLFFLHDWKAMILPMIDVPVSLIGTFAIMEVLWDTSGALTPGQVHEVLLDERSLAYTTVMTTLDRLYKKDLLTRVEEGRAFRYEARLSREEWHRETAGNAFRHLLDASPASSLPLSFLVEILGERDTQLLDDLHKLVELKRRQLGRRETRRGDAGPKETT